VDSRPVSQAFVAHAVARLLDKTRSAYSILRDLDACMTSSFDGKEEFEAQRSEDLASHLGSLGRQLPVLLDLIGMNDTRRSFLSSWEAFANNLGETVGEQDEVNVWLVSRPLRLIDEILEVIGAGSKGVLEEESAGIKILEHVLQATPQILKAHGVVPRKESDVQRVLHDHLESTFDDYSKGIKLPKGLKSFIPDGALPALETLIEVKFVDSKRKVAPIFSGIMEDLSGYGGSRDWTRFYSVIYQTGPFVNETRFDRCLRLSGNAGSWKAIVVGGHGERSTAPRPSKVQQSRRANARKG
jgi:DpnII restriction endonuclease